MTYLMMFGILTHLVPSISGASRHWRWIITACFLSMWINDEKCKRHGLYNTRMLKKNFLPIVAMAEYYSPYNHISNSALVFFQSTLVLSFYTDVVLMISIGKKRFCVLIPLIHADLSIYWWMENAFKTWIFGLHDKPMCILTASARPRQRIGK